MNENARWTTPGDLVEQVQRLWDRGEILRAPRDGAVLFPKQLRLRKPTPADIGNRYQEVRQWIAELRSGAERHGYQVEMEAVDNRIVGKNQVPSRVIVQTEADALGMIARKRDAERFRRAREMLVSQWPVLAEWMDNHPIRFLDVVPHADKIQAVLRWLSEHPYPGVYRRQLEIEGVDTKFIELHRGILTQLLERILPPTAVRGQLGASFDLRFGLREKPTLIRFRILDRSQLLQGLSDLSVPVAEFAALEPSARDVVITENEVNALALPERVNTLVVFGQGYAVERLREIRWLRTRRVIYWGDIDTHGFEMLDRVRSTLPQTESMLMDRGTLLAHRSLWTTEPVQAAWTPMHLATDELQLLKDIKAGVYGANVRLEQERIAFSAVRAALSLDSL